MLETEEKRIERAMVADEEEITQYVHDPSAKVIRALLGNGHLTEDEVLIIANRKNVPANILETIAKDKRWSESYPVRLALARNPKSPLSISLSIARYLRLFDLEEIARCHFIPLAFRRKVETMIIERISTLPLGNKKTLAKKAAGNVLLKLLQDRDPDVVQLCLNNPHLVEGHLYKVISHADTMAGTIRMIAMHPNWSSRSLIRFSLARNGHTPLSLSVRFLQSMKIMDLRELYADPSLPVTIKPFVHRELWERGQRPEKAGGEQVFEIDEEEVEALDAEVTRYAIDGQEEESTSPDQD
ncbi:MAG TPA: hypothetical protein VL087_06385 [Nitrospirota bacterium]|nr:hypothetical protein [Nitrospirota bacterium]